MNFNYALPTFSKPENPTLVYATKKTYEHFKTKSTKKVKTNGPHQTISQVTSNLTDFESYTKTSAFVSTKDSPKKNESRFFYFLRQLRHKKKIDKNELTQPQQQERLVQGPTNIITQITPTDLTKSEELVLQSLRPEIINIASRYARDEITRIEANEEANELLTTEAKSMFPDQADSIVAKLNQKIRKGEIDSNRGIQHHINNNPSVTTATQTDVNEIQTDTQELEKWSQFCLNINNEKISFSVDDVKKRVKYNMLKYKASARLTYFLKCKHAFAVRTGQLLTTLRADARIWMASNNFKMETAEEHEMLTTACIAAFFIDPAEASFINLLQRGSFYNSAMQFNETLTGKAVIHNPSMLESLISNKPALRGFKQSILFGKSVKVNYNNPNSII